MGMAYQRTSGCCQRCLRPFASTQIVIMVRESLTAKEFPGGYCIATKEWVAVCAACATPKEQEATKQDFCCGCEQPLLVPAQYHSPAALCSSRCQQRWRREQKRRYRGSILCRECGAGFQPKRSDSLYCSAACKQKAYRRRSA
jgi:hypothetical protein